MSDTNDNRQNSSPTSPDSSERRRGPSPERLKITYREWKEALQEALEGANAGEMPDSEDDAAEATR